MLSLSYMSKDWTTTQLTNKFDPYLTLMLLWWHLLSSCPHDMINNTFHWDKSVWPEYKAHLCIQIKSMQLNHSLTAVWVVSIYLRLPLVRPQLPIPVSHSLTFPGGSQDFSKRGSHCVKQRVLTSFSRPNIVGCSIEKRLTKGRGGGHRYPRTPPMPARPLSLDPKEWLTSNFSLQYHPWH